MSAPTGMLHDQLDALAEGWKTPHAEAMQCRDVEKIIDKGLSLFSIGRRFDEEWSCKVEAGAPFNAATAKEIIEFYIWWLKPCDYILKRIEDSERKSYKVERANEFREAVNLAKGIASLSAERIARSFSQKAKGETVTLDEALYGKQGRS